MTRAKSSRLRSQTLHDRRIASSKFEHDILRKPLPETKKQTSLQLNKNEALEDDFFFLEGKIAYWQVHSWKTNMDIHGL